MPKKWMIPVLILLAAMAVGGAATYLLSAGPFGKPALATVNGEKITLGRFQQELEKIDPAQRNMAGEELEKFLEIIINQTLLLQAAKKEGFARPTGAPAAGPEGETDALIEAYLDKKASTLPPVTDGEVETFYKLYADRLAERGRAEGTALIRRLLEGQRKGEMVDGLLGDLRKAARIEIDRAELRKLAVASPGAETQSEDDFRKALADGKPTVVDFGSDSCIPCRMLRPVLQKIRQDYAGKVEVLIIDVNDYGKLARDYQIQVIPTVIFFDGAGKESYRHRGFMSEEMIKGRLAKMGVV